MKLSIAAALAAGLSLVGLSGLIIGTVAMIKGTFRSAGVASRQQGLFVFIVAFGVLIATVLIFPNAAYSAGGLIGSGIAWFGPGIVVGIAGYFLLIKRKSLLAILVIASVGSVVGHIIARVWSQPPWIWALSLAVAAVAVAWVVLSRFSPPVEDGTASSLPVENGTASLSVEDRKD